MSEQQKATPGWLARLREHRRARLQQAFERKYFERERPTGLPDSTSSAYRHHAPTGGWFGFGGDAGGCGGGDGGGC